MTTTTTNDVAAPSQAGRTSGRILYGGIAQAVRRLIALPDKFDNEDDDAQHGYVLAAQLRLLEDWEHRLAHAFHTSGLSRDTAAACAASFLSQVVDAIHAERRA